MLHMCTRMFIWKFNQPVIDKVIDFHVTAPKFDIPIKNAILFCNIWKETDQPLVIYRFRGSNLSNFLKNLLLIFASCEPLIGKIEWYELTLKRVTITRVARRSETYAILKHVSDWHCVPFWNMCHSETHFRLALCKLLSHRSRLLNARSWSMKHVQRDQG